MIIENLFNILTNLADRINHQKKLLDDCEEQNKKMKFENSLTNLKTVGLILLFKPTPLEIKYQYKKDPLSDGYQISYTFKWNGRRKDIMNNKSKMKDFFSILSSLISGYDIEIYEVKLTGSKKIKLLIGEENEEQLESVN